MPRSFDQPAWVWRSRRLISRLLQPIFGKSVTPRATARVVETAFIAVSNRFIALMNPFDYIDSVSASVAQHSYVALMVAAIGGLLSTST